MFETYVTKKANEMTVITILVQYDFHVPRLRDESAYGESTR